MRIEIIEERCSRCMLCVRECVSGVWREAAGAPAVVEPDLCNRCGHCIAVCPGGAIIHSGLDAAQSIPVKGMNLDAGVYRNIVLSRRSIRRYRDRAVPRGMIEEMIGLARYAPTASNDQNVGYIVVTDRRLIREIAKGIFGFADRLYGRMQSWPGRVIMKATGLARNRYIRRMAYARELTGGGRDIILHDAPVLLLIHGPAKGSFVCDNCTIAAATVINHAHALGLGTCFIGFLTLALRYSKKLRRKLQVPEGRKVQATLVVGYPAYDYAKTVSRKPAEVMWI